MPDQPVVIRELTLLLRDVPPALDGLRMVHISDLHFCRWNPILRAAQDHLLSLDYDFLAVTGDFGTDPACCQPAADLMQRFFEPIADRTTVYAVLGNHDHPDLSATRGLPITFLANRAVSFERNGAIVNLCGVEQTLIGVEDLKTALAGCDEGGTTILLAHYPSTVFRLPPGRVDVQLSGHTHGGQIRLPWLGALWTNDRISRRMARGLHAVAGTLLHVNPGIGVSPPLRVRFRCPPEISVLTFRVIGSPISPGGGRQSRPADVAPASAIATAVSR